MRQRVGVVIVKDGKVLLLYRKKAGNIYYAVPGGGVEAGETFESAATREAREETSLDITVGPKIGSLAPNEHFYLVTQFSGTPLLGGPEKERNSEDNFYRLEWIGLDRLDRISLKPEIRKIIRSNIS